MTSPSRDDKFWDAMAEEMQRALHLAPLTIEEAALAYEQAGEEPLSLADVDECVAIARFGIRETPEAQHVGSLSSDYAEIDQEVGEVVGMCRNEGPEDPEVEDMKRRQREKALSENDNEEDGDGKPQQKS
jgi:hypothetical protein